MGQVWSRKIGIVDAMHMHAQEKTQDVSVVVSMVSDSTLRYLRKCKTLKSLHAWQGQSPRIASAAPIVSEKMRRFSRNSKYQAKT